MRRDWDMRQTLVDRIQANGGWVNAHSHLDRAYTITPDTLALADHPLQDKWDLVDDIKRRSTVDEIFERMVFATEQQLAQCVSVIGSFIDVDEVIGEKAIEAATRLRKKYEGQVTFVFINQALKGVLEPTANKWFQLGAEFVDIIGGLPGKDNGHEAEHLDVLFETAKRLNKRLHVHVDQFNSPTESETELLVQKTVEHGWQGKVTGIHGVSIAAHPTAYRRSLYAKMKAADVSLVVCPTAWIDSRRNEVLSPTHNSIAPVEELVAAGITVAIGPDNIADIYKPFTDGDIWTELRFLLESCHYYDLDALVTIATTNGRKVLGV